jgi:hypothetical protein
VEQASDATAATGALADDVDGDEASSDADEAASVLAGSELTGSELYCSLVGTSTMLVGLDSTQGCSENKHTRTKTITFRHVTTMYTINHRDYYVVFKLSRQAVPRCVNLFNPNAI